MGIAIVKTPQLDPVANDINAMVTKTTIGNNVGVSKGATLPITKVARPNRSFTSLNTNAATMIVNAGNITLIPSNTASNISVQAIKR